MEIQDMCSTVLLTHALLALMKQVELQLVGKEEKKTDQTNNGMIISFQAEDELSYLDGPTLITVQSCD